jgi:hypothetical protein
MSPMSALCKVCLYYNPGDKTCGRSIVAASKGKIYHNYAKAVRLDKNQCGPHGKWFSEVMGPDGLSKKSPVEELFESFDI